MSDPNATAVVPPAAAAQAAAVDPKDAAVAQAAVASPDATKLASYEKLLNAMAEEKLALLTPAQAEFVRSQSADVQKRIELVDNMRKAGFIQTAQPTATATAVAQAPVAQPALAQTSPAVAPPTASTKTPEQSIKDQYNDLQKSGLSMMAAEFREKNASVFNAKN